MMTPDEAAEALRAAAFLLRRNGDAAIVLDLVRAALGDGADESRWPPGLTVPEAVARLVAPRAVDREAAARLRTAAPMLRQWAMQANAAGEGARAYLLMCVMEDVTRAADLLDPQPVDTEAADAR